MFLASPFPLFLSLSRPHVRTVLSHGDSGGTPALSPGINGVDWCLTLPLVWRHTLSLSESKRVSVCSDIKAFWGKCGWRIFVTACSVPMEMLRSPLCPPTVLCYLGRVPETEPPLRKITTCDFCCQNSQLRWLILQIAFFFALNKQRNHKISGLRSIFYSGVGELAWGSLGGSGTCLGLSLGRWGPWPRRESF